MTKPSTWEDIYSQRGQLNSYPYSECVSYFKRRWPRQVPPGFRALDIGCGSGVHASFFASHGALVTAFDFSPSAIKSAKTLFPHENISYEISSLDTVELTENTYDFAFDRLSSTHSSMPKVKSFYQRLRSALRPGAQIFWQGFTTESSGRDFGQYNEEAGYWDNFSGGVFQNLGPTVFFDEADLAEIFAGYTTDSKRVISDVNMVTGYNHCYWMLELSIPKG